MLDDVITLHLTARLFQSGKSLLTYLWSHTEVTVFTGLKNLKTFTQAYN